MLLTFITIYSTYEGQKYLSERDHLEDLSVDGRVIFIWISKEQDGDMDRIDLPQDIQVAGCCKCDNEPSGFAKCLPN